MSLTVSLRIAGGFVVVVLLLLVISISSFNGVRAINQNLTSVVEQATPMLQTSGELISFLLEGNDRVNRHQKTRELSEIDAIESEFSQIKDNFTRKQKLMAGLAENNESVLKSFNQTKSTISNYFQIVPEVYRSHRSDVELSIKVGNKKSDFEDVSDELDSLVYDFSEDSSDSNHQAILQAIGNLIREATISTTDALNISKISTLETVYKDVQGINKSIQDKLNELTATSAKDSDYFEEFNSAVSTFLRLNVGNENILQLYLTQLKAGETSTLKLAEAETNLILSIKQLRSVVENAQEFANDTKDSAVNQVQNSQSIIVTLALAAIVAAIFISVLVIRSIRQPLNEVMVVIGQIAQGDLTAKINVKSKDEFGTLSDSVNDLVTKLRKILGDISSSSEQLASSAEQTATIAREGHRSINKQREQTELVATAMSQMTATVNEVANSANNTLTEVQHANKETSSGQEIVEENIATINRLAEEIERASQVIHKLNKYSDNIGSVLDVIRGIADQTNLLALNAAIEAARAGEQGRGFAVVADEVRNLASKTQDSTSEIQEMIERLQNGTKDAVHVMKKSQAEAKVSVEQSGRAGGSLESITRAVDVINDMSTHIASSAEEQSAVTNEMHENITSISTLAEQSASGANDSLAASQQLAELAEQLQQMVNQFKI